MESTVCQLSVFVLVAVAVSEQNLLSGSKALTVVRQGLVPVYRRKETIGLSGFVPR